MYRYSFLDVVFPGYYSLPAKYDGGCEHCLRTHGFASESLQGIKRGTQDPPHKQWSQMTQELIAWARFYGLGNPKNEPSAKASLISISQFKVLYLRIRTENKRVSVRA